MDELVAAVEVVAMDIDANAPGTMQQRGSCDTAIGADARPLHEETTINNKDNNDSHTVAREIEDAASKVWNASKVPCNA